MAYNSSFALGIDITIRLARCSGVSAFCKRSMTPHTCERRRESRGAVTARRERVVGAARAGLGWAAYVLLTLVWRRLMASAAAFAALLCRSGGHTRRQWQAIPHRLFAHSANPQRAVAQGWGKQLRHQSGGVFSCRELPCVLRRHALRAHSCLFGSVLLQCAAANNQDKR